MEYLEKINSKSDRGLFLWYSSNSHAFRIYNVCTRTIQETVNIVFDDLFIFKNKIEEVDFAELLKIELAKQPISV